MIKGIFATIGGLVAIILLGFVLNFMNLVSFSFFAPKYRAVENQVYHESEQYNEGMVRDLENLQLAYIQADATGRQSLKAITLHRFAVYPEEKMPANLRNFYNDLRSGKL
jgi:hypothetical protein